MSAPRGHPCLPPLTVTNLSAQPRSSNQAPLCADLTMSTMCRGTAQCSNRAPGFAASSITKSVAASRNKPKSNKRLSGSCGGAEEHPNDLLTNGRIKCSCKVHEQHARVTQPPCSGDEGMNQQTGHVCSPHVDTTGATDHCVSRSLFGVS